MSAASRKKDDKETQDEGKQRSNRNRQSGKSQRRGGQSQQARGQASNGQEQETRVREEPRELEPTEVFNPVSAARLATLRLARTWRYSGKTYAAMHAYERILAKYGGTPAAYAAAEELIAMAGELEREGKFYTALNIFSKIEEYFSPWREEFYDPWRAAYVRPKRSGIPR